MRTGKMSDIRRIRLSLLYSADFWYLMSEYVSYYRLLIFAYAEI